MSLQSKLIHRVIKCIQIAYMHIIGIINRFSTNYTIIIKIYTYHQNNNLQ